MTTHREEEPAMSTTEATEATTFDPIIDPASGEILASTEEERVELVAILGRQLVDAQVAAAAAAHAAVLLRSLMKVGDAWPDPDRPGWAVMMKPPGNPPRQVVTHKLDEHAEGLRPLGLAPREETTTTTVYAKVSELTSKKARDGLARIGLAPEHFLHQPEPGPPSLVVVKPEGL